MRRYIRRHIRSLSSLAVMLSLAVAGGAFGQEQTGNDNAFGDWLLRCAVNDTTRCALTQRIVNSETREVVAEIGVAPVAAGIEGYALVLSVPEGADLAAAPAFKLEGADAQNAMAWRVCINGMCQASANLPPAGAAAMDAAGRGVFGYRQYRQEGLTVARVSFNGFAEGLAAMDAR